MAVYITTATATSDASIILDVEVSCTGWMRRFALTRALLITAKAAALA